MGLTTGDVSAVLITRGNVDMAPILASLPYEDVVLWDDRERGSNGCYSRYLAMAEAKHEVIYFQDDDLVFTAHQQLLEAYEPGRITCNMPSPWYEREQYGEIDCQLVGAGSLVDRELPPLAFERYLEHWPMDDQFLTWCDMINGVLTPGVRFDWGYEILPQAYAADRINTQLGSRDRKWVVLNRALELRAQVAA